MDLALIVAVARNHVIGCNNTIPWHLPEDLKRFRELTLHSVVVMGRKTFESLPNQQPLKHRIHIVLSRQHREDTGTDNVRFVQEEDVFDVLRSYRDKKIFIIGGADIYNMFYPYCPILYVTVIEEDMPGNAYFPYSWSDMTQNGALVEESETYTSKHNHLKYKYCTVHRNI